jgi:hypothetical protein
LFKSIQSSLEKYKCFFATSNPEENRNTEFQVFH